MARVKSATQAVAPQLELGNRRMKKGLSLEQIAESTKISIRFLRAIEDEEFHKLPGGIFNTSYLKQYASATGFEEEKLIALYHRTVGGSQPEEMGLDQGGRGLFRWFRVSTANH
jgi:cytoskeletal protein RodZ